MKVPSKKILLITGMVIILPLIFILVVLILAFHNLQSRKELLSFKNATASIVLSEDGNLLGKIYTENRTNISFDQIPPQLINALIATEDARFYEHGGVDSRSLMRVLFKTIIFNKQSSGGGSTLTQQLAKNMFGRKYSGPFAIFINKSREVLLANRLEKLFSKNEILTLYLNTVPFGENVFGIQAASRRFFSKNAGMLDLSESAVLVGMLKANNLYNPRLNPVNARNRRNVVLNQMLKYNYLKRSATDSISKLPIVLHYSNLEAGGPADYFLYQVKTETKQILENINSADGAKWNLEEDGLIITTTLNLSLQESALRSFHDHLSVMQARLEKQYSTPSGKKFIADLADNEIRKLNLQKGADIVATRQVFDWNGPLTASISLADSVKSSIKLLHAGFLAIDPATGAIRAWVGGIDFRTQPYDQVLARRQMGSTFKPLIYANALEKGIRPCFYLDNDTVVVEGPNQWSPKNYDLTYGGKYSLTGALVHSMNIPTFNLFSRVGFGSLDSLWKKLGFSFKLDNTPALALGTAEANVREVAIAYSVFANGGSIVTPYDINSIKTADGKVIWEKEPDAISDSVLSKRTCQLMNAILQKAVREGTGSPLGAVFGVELPFAGKTGTTQDYADSWFVAYNPSLVLVSRVGASLPSVHFSNGANGSGSSLALPLIGLTLRRVQNDPLLKGKFASVFPELAPELYGELDCPDYRDKNVIENIISIFKKDKTQYEISPRTNELKKKSFFRRLFGKRK